MLAWLLGLIDPITRITNAIVAYKTKIADAKTERERIESEERIGVLEARRAVLVAESGSRLNSIMRAAFALPFIIYNAKLVIWDKVLSLGTTDPLSAELFQVEIACIGFYFLYDMTKIFKK